MFSDKPEVLVISDAAFNKLTEVLEAPAEPTPALVALMKRKPRWAESAAESESVSPLTPASRIKPTPQIGQTCWIKHQVKRANNGEVLGLQRADGKPVAARITAVFLDGTVRTGNSDIWEVQPSTLGNWETVNPFHGK